MTNPEHETIIHFDYESKMVGIYTTREGVKSGIKRRLGEDILNDCEVIRDTKQSWEIEIPFKYCRTPQLICKLINPDEKTPMPEGIFTA